MELRARAAAGAALGPEAVVTAPWHPTLRFGKITYPGRHQLPSFGEAAMGESQHDERRQTGSHLPPFGAVRVTHWVNVVALLVLLMSGLQIFNAHPALYFGSKSNFDDPVMAMRPMKHGEELVGVTTIAGWNIDTTGLFGLAYDERRRLRDQRLSLVGDVARPSRSRHRAALALLLRLALRHQRARLSHLQPRERAPQRATSRRAAAS